MVESQKVKERIIHRYPFLLIDEIISLVEGKSAVGIKNVTENEHFFKGHFPEYQIVPSCLIIEALAQIIGIAMSSKAGDQGRLGFLAGIDHCYLKRQVRPGEQLQLEAVITRCKGTSGKGKGIATVHGEVVCEVELLFLFVEYTFD